MISASVVTYCNKPDELNKLFNSINNSRIDILYIVDHSPSDWHAKFVYPEGAVIIKHQNKGYGSGHNIAIRKAIELGADYHVVLNPDIYWSGDIISSLEKYMDENPSVGQVMPKVFYPNGDLQYICKMCPTPLDLIFKRFLPSYMTQKRMDKFQLKFTNYDKIINAPYLSGCFMFFRMTALKDVGLFDERYFMYPEDIDITRRIHSKYKTIFYPFVSIIHAHAAASKTNKKMLRIHIFNMIKYFNKWGWIFDKQRKNFNKQLLEDLSKY